MFSRAGNLFVPGMGDHPGFGLRIRASAVCRRGLSVLRLADQIHHSLIGFAVLWREAWHDIAKSVLSNFVSSLILPSGPLSQRAGKGVDPVSLSQKFSFSGSLHRARIHSAAP
jgi:hypothetical protein